MYLLIKNIKGLVQVRTPDENIIRGAEMKKLPTISNAFLLLKDDKIESFGEMAHCPILEVDTIDATGKFVFPSYVDSHTHIVYAGSRESEFVMRLNGATYEEIAAAGGGILNSAKRLASATEEELFDSAWSRLMEVIKTGTGAIEIKSGYGLSLEAELKMLKVIKLLKEKSPIPVKATFLGAHAIPTVFKNNREGYIKLIIDEMLPAIAKENLAEYIDVFCEENYFSKPETILILNEGKKYGLNGKVHAEQLSHAGGVEVGVACQASSVDHLEFVNANDIELLKNSGTIPTILPGAAFFLGLPNPPARQMIDAGLPLAIASDYNPGSCPSGNINFMISLACIQYKMLPEEAINAATINSANAINLQHELGSITVGKRANIFITEAIPDYAFLPYSFGNTRIETVIINGKKFYKN